MISLDKLVNPTRPFKRVKRVGRGPGSGVGKTCGRGEKGAGSRSGYKRRYGYEGGQLPLYRRLPCRGFSNAAFRNEYEPVNLDQIDKMFEDGEIVNCESLIQKGFFKGRVYGIKILGNGELTKNVTIEADDFSKTAQEKLKKSKISFSTVQH